MPKLMEWNTELEKPLSLDRFIEIRYNVTPMIKAAEELINAENTEIKAKEQAR